MTARACVGIDPGATGAAVFLDLDSSLLLCYDDHGGKVTASHARAAWLREVLDGYQPTEVTVGIEAPPHALPPGMGQGVSAMVKLAQNAGVWEGIVAAMGLSYSYVAAMSWKAAMGLVKHPKADSLIVARREFPWASVYFQYKTKDVGRADAALIALFTARRLQLR